VISGGLQVTSVCSVERNPFRWMSIMRAGRRTREAAATSVLKLIDSPPWHSLGQVRLQGHPYPRFNPYLNPWERKVIIKVRLSWGWTPATPGEIPKASLRLPWTPSLTHSLPGLFQIHSLTNSLTFSPLSSSGNCLVQSRNALTLHRFPTWLAFNQTFRDNWI
jgi:hypothetical protein